MKKTFSLLTVSIMILTNSVLAQVQSENLFVHKVGQAEVILLSEGTGQGNGDILLNATPQMRHEAIPSGTFPNAFNSFLVRTPERNILVDAGTQSVKLFSNLGTFGINPEQINVILITHAHGDHIGGLLANGKVAFPNAQIYIPQPEYDYWMSDSVMLQFPENSRGGFLSFREIIAVYKDNINLFQPVNALEKDLYAPHLPVSGISAIYAPGHTPGHTMYMVESGNEQMLIWGDITHAMAIQMPYPSVAVTYDVDPKLAVVTREKVFDYVSRNNIPVAGMHVPFPAMGIVSTLSSGGYVFYPYDK